MQKTFLLFLLCFSHFAQATIVPENNLAIPASSKHDGLSEFQYHQVIDKVEKIYRPIVEKMGKKLKIERLWENSRVNAGTVKKGNEIILRMYGGYARHPKITEDAFALVLCHELGHHLGGTPRKTYDETGEIAWPSTEGQADYFATLKCLRKVFRGDDNGKIISQKNFPLLAKEKCESSFKTDWEVAMCIRTIVAGIDNSKISAAIRNTEDPQIETPDSSVVEKTYEEHPVPQCRLDTYFQGAICEVSSFRSVSDQDEMVGTCHVKNGHADGVRPACWFKSL